MKANNFADSIAQGENAGDDPIWEAAFRKAYPDLANITRTNGTPSFMPAQAAGIDWTLHLSSGQNVRVDRKARSKSYPDFALETHHVYASGRRSNSPGWMCKSLLIDVLAYGFMPERRVYLLPWLTLRGVWLERKAEWWRLARAKRFGFSLCKAWNSRGEYWTHNLCVPRDTLLESIRDAMVVDVPEAA